MNKKTTKTINWKRHCALVAALVVVSSGAWAASEELKVPFSDPSKTGRVDISILHGKVRIEGYDGREVLITSDSKSMARPMSSSRAEREGMKRIGAPAGALSIDERNNVMRMKSNAMMGESDLFLRVPQQTEIKVKCVNCTTLTVNNVSGGVELESLNGNVEIANVSGSISVHSLNNKIKATLRRVEEGKALAFSSMNGEIDVTFPASLRADVVVDNLNGETFTDFEMQLEPNREVESKDNRDKGGSYRAEVSRNFKGKINGGGTPIRFKNINGDILIRKGQ